MRCGVAGGLTGTPMMPDRSPLMGSKAEDYRAGAGILLRVVGKIEDHPEAKHVFEDLAKEWLQLAEQIEEGGRQAPCK